jgi:hypothetical protein
MEVVFAGARIALRRLFDKSVLLLLLAAAEKDGAPDLPHAEPMLRTILQRSPKRLERVREMRAG